MAVAHGASAVGLVSSMPSGPGPIPDELIAEIAATVPPGVFTFLLTCLQDCDSIVAQHRLCRTSAIQLVDELPVSELCRVRLELPGVKLVQVIHVRSDEDVDVAQSIAPHVDALLLDSGNPALSVKELGGTGRIHDWAISRRIVASVPVPVYLAGGLNADNVRSAIEFVRPFGIDACSGLRTGGALDAAKLSRFVAAIHS
jgi:phosphoribosylanthranilate isomerase